MCTMSMVGDFYMDKWKERPFWTQPDQGAGGVVPVIVETAISRAEFDALRKEVADMKDLLKRAKKYDEDNGEPDCEVDEKMDVLRKIAKLVGVDLDDVLTKHGQSGDRTNNSPGSASA